MLSDLWWDLRHGDYMAWVTAILLVAVVLLVCFLLIWGIDQVWLGEPTFYQAEIVDGIYKPDTRETNVMPVIGSDSKGNLTTGVIVANSGSSEKFTLMVRDYRTYEVYAVDVNPTIYYSSAIGDVVRMAESKGKILGSLNRKVIQ